MSFYSIVTGKKSYFQNAFTVSNLLFLSSFAKLLLPTESPRFFSCQVLKSQIFQATRRLNCLGRKFAPVQHNSNIQKTGIFTFFKLYYSALATERLKGKPKKVFVLFFLKTKQTSKTNKQKTTITYHLTFPVLLLGSKFDKKTRDSTDNWSDKRRTAKPTHDQR